MEKPTDLEKKYHTITLEYSKVRSQATVLKKAVIDEQTKNLELKQSVKELELKIRKHDQEMESLTFRNEQLTKRISVLQQELQANSYGNKKGKSKHVENTNPPLDYTVFDEELHKKIVENAELVSKMTDKNLEIENYKEKIELLEQRITQLQKQISETETKHGQELEKMKRKISSMEQACLSGKTETGQGDNVNIPRQDEVERWRKECEILRAKPATDEALTEFYELQIRELLDEKQMAVSETQSFYAENEALTARIERLLLEKNRLENSILSNVEELHTTSDNYKSQLDAMTEHLAAQNEKITKQCDEIQILKHKLSLKK